MIVMCKKINIDIAKPIIFKIIFTPWMNASRNWKGIEAKDGSASAPSLSWSNSDSVMWRALPEAVRIWVRMKRISVATQSTIWRTTYRKKFNDVKNFKYFFQFLQFGSRTGGGQLIGGQSSFRIIGHVGRDGRQLTRQRPLERYSTES